MTAAENQVPRVFPEKKISKESSRLSPRASIGLRQNWLSLREVEAKVGKFTKVIKSTVRETWKRRVNDGHCNLCESLLYLKIIVRSTKVG
jgi:hypothetical protein